MELNNLFSIFTDACLNKYISIFASLYYLVPNDAHAMPDYLGDNVDRGEDCSNELKDAEYSKFEQIKHLSLHVKIRVFNIAYIPHCPKNGLVHRIY